MLSFYTRLCTSVEYSLAGTELTISGPGAIKREEVLKKPYKEITKVFIKEGPTEICMYTFSDCVALNEIHIPKSVTLIDSNVFINCLKLKDIFIDKDNQHYIVDEQGILYNKTKTQLIRAPTKTNLQIPEGVEEIVDGAFNVFWNFNFGNVVFPSTIKTLYSDSFHASRFDTFSFQKNSKLEVFGGFMYSIANKVIIPNSVTKIAEYAFHHSDIYGLEFEEVSKLETLANNAFDAIFQIKVIKLPESVKYINDNAFKDARELTKVIIGQNCENISFNAFTNCKELTEIEISTSNTHYSSENGIVMNFQKTEIIFLSPGKDTVEIGSNIEKLGVTALQNSRNLVNIVLTNNNRWSQENGILYSPGFDTVIAACGGCKDVCLHTNVKTIGSYAFSNCLNLNSISFNGNLLETIEEFAFDSSSILSFDLPPSVTIIKGKAFQRARNLTQFNIPEESLLHTIGEQCFLGTSLNSIHFRKNIQKIGIEAFSCKSITEILFDEVTQTITFGRGLFSSASITSITIPSTVITIPEQCFHKCYKLNSITFNNVLGSIGYRAFKNCSSLRTINLPDSCTTIEAEAFLYCSKLDTVNNNLEKIEVSAFESCVSLKSFQFSVRQTAFPPIVFRNCVELTQFSVTEGNPNIKVIGISVFDINGEILIAFPPGEEFAIIPASASAFSENAFAWSPKLKHVAFYNGSALKTIGKYSFLECKLLQTFQFPGTLTEIENNAFQDCVSLKSITLPIVLNKIGSKAFAGCPLHSVKYCGIHIIEGTDVFESFVKISVTDVYEGEMFCSRSVVKKLTYDCEIKPKFLPSCKYPKISYNSLACFSLVMLIIS